MEFIAPNNYHVIDDPLNAIAEIRQKSISDDLDDDPFYICDISDIIRKHRIWQEQMPRVFPFYGEFNNIFESLLNCEHQNLYKNQLRRNICEVDFWILEQWKRLFILRVIQFFHELHAIFRVKISNSAEFM